MDSKPGTSGPIESRPIESGPADSGPADKSRRDFLAKLGSATLFGIGASIAIGRFAGSTPIAAVSGEAEQEGIRWGMLVDMTRCSADCTDCIDACHSVHNVPDFGNPKDEIKWLWKQDYINVFPSKSHEFAADTLTEKPVLTLCNHCADPPCVKVCPTKATFQRPDGIVEMDFHRCIGCRYCMAGCPYGARSFNWRDPRPFIEQYDPSYPTREMGVVEKCNFCSERLAKGKQPACVETCQDNALTFGNLHDDASDIRRQLRKRVTFQRKPELGARPSVFYAFEGGND